MDEMERRLVNLEIAAFGKTGNRWHSTDELPSGVKTGTIGASTHITDLDGFPVSKGFHSIDEEIPQMTFVGKTGATVTRFRLDMCDLIRRKISRPSPPEPQLIQGYTAENWQEIIAGGYLCEFGMGDGQWLFAGYLAEFNDKGYPVCNPVASDCIAINTLRDCRPAQLKGVMRPIFVEPEPETECLYFDEKNNYKGSGYNCHDSFVKNRMCTKYIEL